MQSRVNLAIRYKDLDDKMKKAIVGLLNEQLTDDDTNDKQQLLSWLDNDEESEDFGGSLLKELIGRQIQNLLLSAASIAQDDSDRSPKREHIKKNVNETTNFQKDIEWAVQVGRGEAKIAYPKKGLSWNSPTESLLEI